MNDWLVCTFVLEWATHNNRLPFPCLAFRPSPSSAKGWKREGLRFRLVSELVSNSFRLRENSYYVIKCDGLRKFVPRALCGEADRNRPFPRINC